MKTKFVILTLAMLVGSGANAIGDLILKPSEIEHTIQAVQSELANGKYDCQSGSDTYFNAESVEMIKKSNINFISKPDLIDRSSYRDGNLTFVRFGDGGTRYILHFNREESGRVRNFKFVERSYTDVKIKTGDILDPEVQVLRVLNEEVSQVCVRR